MVENRASTPSGIAGSASAARGAPRGTNGNCARAAGTHGWTPTTWTSTSPSSRTQRVHPRKPVRNPRPREEPAPIPPSFQRGNSVPVPVPSSPEKPVPIAPQETPVPDHSSPEKLVPNAPQETPVLDLSSLEKLVPTAPLGKPVPARSSQ